MRRTFDLHSFNHESMDNPMSLWHIEMPDEESWFGFLITTLAIESKHKDFADSGILKIGMLDLVVSGVDKTVGTIVFVAPEDMTDEEFVWLKMRWG